MNSATTSTAKHKTTLRFTSDDWQQIRAKVQASGLTTNDYFRQLALQTATPKPTQTVRQDASLDGQDKRLCVRLRPVEMAIVQHHAELEGLSQSAYVRQLILEAPLPRKKTLRVPEVHAKVLGQWVGELGSIGNNINQIAKNLNIAAKAGDLPMKADCREVLKALDAVETLLAESAKDILNELHPATAA